MAIVLFDGVCNLGTFSVRFIMERDPEGYFRFALLQSPAGQALLREHDIQGTPESVALIEGVHAYRRSDAALSLVSAPVRDAVYDFVAHHRDPWFGRQDAGLLPTPARRARLLDDAASAE